MSREETRGNTLSAMYNEETRCSLQRTEPPVLILLSTDNMCAAMPRLKVADELSRWRPCSGLLMHGGQRCADGWGATGNEKGRVGETAEHQDAARLSLRRGVHKRARFASRSLVGVAVSLENGSKGRRGPMHNHNSVHLFSGAHAALLALHVRRVHLGRVFVKVLGTSPM